MEFKLHSEYAPTGDQPEAIDTLVRGFQEGNQAQTLLGVTGSGKTFTMANIISRLNKPTLIIAHNKTLAAQLYSEFKEFFPENAVEYFVSYYDYYQPEAYVPSSDTYIAKDSAVNDEIDKLRLSALSSLSERRDVIIVASVSCIYGIGAPEDFANMMTSVRPGMQKDRDDLIRELIDMQYERNEMDFHRGTFRVKGDTLEIIPAKFVVHEDHYENYKCTNCTGEDSEEEVGKTQFAKTPHIPMVYPGSYCSASLVAFLMVQKYVMGSPLYRLEMDFMRSGIELSRQTMSNWMIYCAETWLIPLYEKLHQMLLQAEIINADETELQVLREPGRKAQTKSYMWLYRTGSYAENQIILYEYQPGRGSMYPLSFLEGFTGYLQTDGYVGYDALEKVTHVGCFAHLKRKFHDAVAALPNGKKSGSAVEGEAYCEKLFQLERRFADLSYEERKQKRQELAKPVLDEFLAWAATRTASSKSKLGEALTYLHNNGKELSEYLNDGRLEISNNIAERSIKPFVIDRKNFLFSNTPKGATASAVTFSIIQTAIANNLNPYFYLSYLFTEAPKMAANGVDWVTAMLPHNAPASCKAEKKDRGQY